MPIFNIGDAVDLLDGGKVVAKGRVINVDPSSTIHGQPIPAGHVSVTVVYSLKGTVYIPHVPAHEGELCTIEDVVGYIIAWPRVALAVASYQLYSNFILFFICMYHIVCYMTRQ